MHNKQKKVLITGGAGYVGSALVPRLLQQGYKVTVLDTFWFWNSPEEFLAACGSANNNADNNAGNNTGNNTDNLTDNLTIVQGDLRNHKDVLTSLQEVESVIHLACISNDPSSDLDPAFTHSVNYAGSINIIDLAKAAGVKRFIYASSSSVYGIKKEPQVTEDLPLEPLTQYSQLKVEIEHYLLHRLDEYFQGVIIRPSTVCGYSPRPRLDLVVNILANLAINKGKIKVLGGEQLRPNIHMKDMVRLYELLLEVPPEKINRRIYNAGYENLKVKEIAALVQTIVGNVQVEIEDTNDQRSYHVCSDKIRRELGFDVQHTVREAIQELQAAFEQKKIVDVDNERYYNVKRMKTVLREGNKSKLFT